MAADVERIPLYEEALSVGKRTVERGAVRITTRVSEREETVEQALRSESVEVTRVPVGRPVDAVPEPRREGDVLIVPVIEEELVVTKRLVLREELHIRTRAEERTERVSVTLRSEDAVVTREEPTNPSHPIPQE
ncbi:YsnF/AvaK domain-containing protein [Azospirillum sp. SYSU D00513]|uniref:YsnF/AvaK domain-containing protein n=1 Tax=Azospirillum sp. SYSU D00513 TaxID=2812561 RepID=UPI001A9661B9|nr:YsnF/AvaK domain-containing protein [Azospirillum sp. SYSU D00513]